jgi:hypothetical protein
VPRLKKEWSFTSAPPLRLHGRLQGELYLFRTRSKPVVQYVPGCASKGTNVGLLTCQPNLVGSIQ